MKLGSSIALAAGLLAGMPAFQMSASAMPAQGVAAPQVKASGIESVRCIGCRGPRFGYRVYRPAYRGYYRPYYRPYYYRPGIGIGIGGVGIGIY